MPQRPDYTQKFDRIAQQTPFRHLPERERRHIRTLAHQHRFTLQELRTVSEIAQDLQMWQQGDILQHWPLTLSPAAGKQQKQRLIGELRARWASLRQQANRYPPGLKNAIEIVRPSAITQEKGRLGLGSCPVASPRTRCCNLLTLDAVDNCGYGCSYCSIQSFFTDHQVFFDPEFSRKLETLEIDPQRVYHIGTGQSSDSLMWGNSHGVLDALIAFAQRDPNVILELKTKSGNISHLLKQGIPVNLICTWSLNPAVIVDHEEHGTASLARRLQAAETLAGEGAIVGFHFHPMIHFEGWEQAYSEIFQQVQQRFSPDQVAMVSLGTLTYTKPVIRNIRVRGIPSQILKLPLEEADSKLSYPEPTKLALFRHAWHAFASAWQERVFFYLCMENQRLWKPVFGFDYDNNDAFEAAMKASYMTKIDACRRATDD